MKRRCKNCNRPLAKHNKKPLCFCCQEPEFPKNEHSWTPASDVAYNEYHRAYKSRRRAMAL